MIGNDPGLSIADNYRAFAREAATGRSPLYVVIANGIAEDDELIAFLAAQPPAKRQPNLLLGAVRFLSGTQQSYDAFRAAVLEHREEVAATLATRRTQTNEAGRCASLPEPLALLEVGAAAGLCLIPDRFAYRYDQYQLGDSELVLECTTSGSPPLPGKVPRIAWRAGIDIAPVDVTDDDAIAWLEALVWPDRPDRVERLRRAVALARRDPPTVHAGHLLDLLEPLAAQAPANATLVVFHTAVLAYLEDARRAEFVRRVRAMDCHWISNEGPNVIPAHGPGPASKFVLALDGHPVAHSDPHGATLDWL